MTAPKRRWPLVVAGLLAVIVAGVAAWYFWPRATRDPLAAARANARGIAYLERFDYPAAVQEFEAAVAHDPDSLPGRVNLGIALLNTATPDGLRRALEVFAEVLRREPRNAHAHYGSGIIHLYQNRLEEAARHFAVVTEIDPQDAHAWYHRGLTHPEKDTSAESKAFFRKALDLDPYLNAARYALAQHQFEYDEARSRALLDEQKQLVDANWETEYRLRYTEMGRYAEAIGRVPAEKPATGPLPLFERDTGFRVALAEGARWAKADDRDALGRAVGERFGGTLVRLDYDGDGKADLLLLGGVVRGGKVGKLLLHNDGGTFSDATAKVGLGDAPASFGCSVADFDNDGRPDLLLTGPAGLRLYRNAGGTFEDRTADAGLDREPGVYLGCGWVDLDQDGDLDLLAGRYAATAEAALARLTGGADAGGGLAVFLNTGEAPSRRPDGTQPGLTCKFKPATAPEALLVRGSVVGFVASDLDADRDVDLLVLADGRTPVVVLNDRLMRFHAGANITDTAADWNGGLVLDANHDEQSDLLLVPAGGKPALLLSQRDAPADGTKGRFTAGATDAPPLLQAQAVDLDRDGWADVVGLSQERTPVLLHNDGTGRLVVRGDVLAPGAKVGELLAVSVGDLAGDGSADVLLWAADGLHAWRNRGNGNRVLRVEPTGRRDKGSNLRTNADGIGTRVTAHAGPLTTAVENTTLAAGLGQSRGPLELGLGRAGAADVLRLRWPDGVPQAELNLAAGEVHRIAELNRKGTSCPVLLAWDGQRFVFVTDFLGAGALGELGPDGSVRPPRPEESVKIEPGRLVPRAGRFALKIAEPMDEVLYLDHLRLDVIDHPADVEVHPDERFATTGPQPSQELLAFRDRIFPVRAIDHRGQGVAATLRERDGKTASGFAPRSWLGFAEEHFVELDFGDRLARLPANERLYLVLAGWIDYPYPESIYAASQAGVAMVPPVLERLGRDGRWESLGEIGFPAGLPRVMTAEVPGLAGAADCRLRLRTNLQIHWDRIYLAAAENGERRVHSLGIERAALAHRGFMQETTPGGGPVVYDDDRTEPVATTRWRGQLTPHGDVRELLRGPDDRFVLCGPGDEIVVEFDASKLPPIPPGQVRSFVLRTWGYCKDTSPFTLTGGSVEPLPYRGMKAYPPTEKGERGALAP